jgi:phosphatidylserine decarboxylase
MLRRVDCGENSGWDRQLREVRRRGHQGAIVGMIRIGSQVDVVVPWRDGMTVRVRPGDRVRAGQTVLVD